MSIRVGVNGFGRIGRNLVRRTQGTNIEVVAINDVAKPAVLANLLTYDSTFGRYPGEVEVSGDALLIDDRLVPVTAEHDPAGLDWGASGVDIVVEATGRFRSRSQAALHLKSGAKKVIISAPGQDVDATIVRGVNDAAYDAAVHDVISCASCTTNCVAPMALVLHEAFGIVKGYMTTVHGYTNDQVVLDSPHKDPRRGRSAAVNIIPTSTGAAKSIGLVIPELAGRIDGVALRVPVEDGSLTDLACVLASEVSAAEVNAAFAEAAASRLTGIIRYSIDPIVSRDVLGDPASCVLDSLLTQANGSLIKVFGWYDNEWGYTSRLAELIGDVGAGL